MNNITAIILAAGKGTRMNAPIDRNKVTFELQGHPLVWWTRKRLSDVGIDSVITVVGHAAESVKKSLGDTVKYVTQLEQLGTGDAVKTALPHLPENSTSIITMYGDDSAFYTTELLKGLVKSHESSGADMTLLTIHQDNPSGLGRIKRDSKGNVKAIIEEKVATASQKKIKEVNAGLYCFKHSFLKKAIEQVEKNPVSQEYYLTDILAIAISQKAKVNTFTSKDQKIWFGVNTRDQLQQAQIFFRNSNLNVSKNISILIPCRNEELTIGACIESCLNQTIFPAEIIIINDGSTDKSSEILEEYKKLYPKLIKIVTIPGGSGQKSRAQEIGLSHIHGEICVSTDADTILDNKFVENIIKNFDNPDVAAVGGYVKSKKYNWLTLCRAFDYVIGQNIYKVAQHHLGSILVIPGAAAAFRTKLFMENISLGHDTITEDLDITYQLHKKGLKIVFDPSAVVYTQDPVNLSSYVTQIRRWYGGGWQNLRKHLDKNLVSHPGRMLELSLSYIEGIMYAFLLLAIPIINIRLTGIMYVLLVILLFLQSLYAAKIEKRLEMLLIPIYYLPIMYIHSVIFIEQFFKEWIFRTQNMQWHQPRRVAI